MKISELAQRSGLTASRIRFYESKGLLRAVERQVNGYREYPAEAVTVLGIIACAQQTGFTLDEIGKMLPTDMTHWRHDELIAALQKKIADIEAMEQQLAQSRAHLQSLIETINAKPEGMACADNARRVLGEIGKDAGGM